jgi:hypothetical protein
LHSLGNSTKKECYLPDTSESTQWETARDETGKLGWIGFAHDLGNGGNTFGPGNENTSWTYSGPQASAKFLFKVPQRNINSIELLNWTALVAPSEYVDMIVKDKNSTIKGNWKDLYLKSGSTGVTSSFKKPTEVSEIDLVVKADSIPVSITFHGHRITVRVPIPGKVPWIELSNIQVCE